MPLRPLLLLAFTLTLAATAPAAGAQAVTSPREAFGHDLGADYSLVDYRQLSEYWTTLARQSDRMRLERIGTTSEGRPMLMAILTAPENHPRLNHYQEIARRLALAEGMSETEARALAAEGKAVIWIDGGLHATEVLGAQQLMEIVHQLASASDPETLRILRDVIVLAVHANPDGHDLVADWYMRRSDPLERSLTGLPRLYHKYIGHDNNRDSYMASQVETRAMDSVMFRAWYPQIMYNHHQTSPRGTIMFAPPFRDPFNYNFDPLVVTMLDQVGAAMHSRMIAEGKPGTVMRNGANFSTWWNGGLRTTAYFHNIVGLLTETFGSPTPQRITLVPSRLLPSGSLPYPIVPQEWRFRQAMDYERTANLAVLDFASKHREELLYNIYRMGKNSIERGSGDNWSLTPSRIRPVAELVGADTVRQTAEEQARYLMPLRDPALRDARAYVIPADQPDFPTATLFVNTLIKTGVSVHRATAPFRVGPRTYPAGSYVVKAAQAFRPHVRDMFEPQDHPDDVQYPGGPPVAPYDVAGYTLVYQMGIAFDRVLDALDGPFEEISGFATITPGRVVGGGVAAGYLLERTSNNAFIAINRLLAAGHAVSQLQAPLTASGRTFAPGTFFVPANVQLQPLLGDLTGALGVDLLGVQSPPGIATVPVPAARIGLWDVYGGSMTSGWTRWLFEQFEFPFQLVFAPEIDAGNLRSRFDVIVLPSDAVVLERQSAQERVAAQATAPPDAPAEWRARSGTLTRAASVPQLRRFLEEGGTILTIGNATSLAYELGLRVTSALADSAGAEPPRASFYIPGSVLRMRLDTARPIAHGLGEHVDVFFHRSPAFRLVGGVRDAGTRTIGWYDSAEPLRSGWAWGQHHLEGASGVVEVSVGRGRLVMYGPEVLFRAQPHGTFRLLFNGIYYSGAVQ
ncbi:M14 family metallopeptidase [soil metagenome]